jgi:AraC-like DNA-binding protein
LGKGYSPEQIVRKLREAEGKLASGSTIGEISRELGISETTFHRMEGSLRRDEQR